MATRLYPYRDAGPGITPAFDASWEGTASAIRYRLNTNKDNSSFSTLTALKGNGTNPNDVLFVQLISWPLVGSGTIGGTLKGQMLAIENVATIEARSQLVAKVISGDGSTVRGTLVSSDASAESSEWATAVTNRKFPLAAISPVICSSVAYVDGDKIVIEVGMRVHSTNSANGASIRLGGNAADLPEDETTTTDGTPWFEFSDTLTFGSIDTGSGTDASSLTAQISGTAETGAGDDTAAASLTATIPVTETGAGADASTSLTVTEATSDTGSGADASSLSATLSGTAEAGAGADASSLVASMTRSDTAHGVDAGSVTDRQSQGWIEAWVTEPDETYIAHLDRTADHPYRRFEFSRELNAEGAGALEYVSVPVDGAFDFGNLVWMKFRGTETVWVIEERAKVLDDKEATNWTKISGKGVLTLLGDRTIWPSAFSETGDGLIPRTWSGAITTLSATAHKDQKHVFVDDPSGFHVGKRITIGSPHKNETSRIDSRSGNDITLHRKLSHTYSPGVTISVNGNQWYEVEDEHAGEMLWDLIDISNPRFTTQIGRGNIANAADDLWTQRFRFDNLLEVVKAVTAAYGDVTMTGLDFNYWNRGGTDRSAAIIFEEGVDLIKLDRQESDRDAESWIVAEGVGEGVFAKLAVASNDLASRRREAYLNAHDADSLSLLQLDADTALLEHARHDSVGFEFAETRYFAMVDFHLGDWVTVYVPSRGISGSLRVVAIYVKETDDEQTRISIDVNSKRTDRQLRLQEGNHDTSLSLSITNRQPQGQLTAFTASGQGQCDADTPIRVAFTLLDRMSTIIEVRVNVQLDKFGAPARSVLGGTTPSGGGSETPSGGGSTTPSGGASTTPAGGASTSGGTAHFHMVALNTFGGAGGWGLSKWGSVGTPAQQFDLASDPGGSGEIISADDSPAHTHTTPNHTHDTPNHTHATPDHVHDTPDHEHDIPALSLQYGTFEESLPTDWSGSVWIEKLDGSDWDTTPLDAQSFDKSGDGVFISFDFTDTVDEPGTWRVVVQPDAGDNNGRLSAQVWISGIGAIESE